MYVHFLERVDQDQDDDVLADGLMAAHPRVGGTYWEEIGWNAERYANEEADLERIGYARDKWGRFQRSAVRNPLRRAA